MKALKKRISIACDECRTVISGDDESQLMRRKMEHIYRFHTVDFAKNIVKAVPQVKAIGERIGQFMRENIKP